jgi:hypothetical protein
MSRESNPADWPFVASFEWKIKGSGIRRIWIVIRRCDDGKFYIQGGRNVRGAMNARIVEEADLLHGLRSIMMTLNEQSIRGKPAYFIAIMAMPPFRIGTVKRRQRWPYHVDEHTEIV